LGECSDSLRGRSGEGLAVIPVQGVEGRGFLVLGLARSGLAAARALRAGGASVRVWDDGASARATAEGEGFTAQDPLRERGLDGIEGLVVSPGIPHLYPAPHPAIARAQALGVAVDNDVGLFFRSFATPGWDQFDTPPRVVAVTGSNGKSTTTALIAHILREAGRAVQVGGNIGRGVLDLDPAADGSVAVLELSSYQTELARALTPDVAVFTNLTPDHLDRHGGMGGYFAAKRRLFTEGGPDRAVIGVDEGEGRFLANQLAQGTADDRVIRISAGQKLEAFGWSVFARRGFLAEWRKGRQVASVDLRTMAGLPGAHNHQNACAAWAAGRALGLAPRQIEAALATFGGLPHRCQIVAEGGGVRFVNDSKATNAEATAHAIAAFPKIRWILGGRAKEGGIAVLGNALGSIVKAYLVGEAAEAFAGQLPPSLPREHCGDIPTAVKRAGAEAEPGEVVLLSPAAASFDQFRDFEHRGEVFTDAARRAAAARG
jgi:UDP-N-acetylmuramoylalanine--D-glutamate ligase